MQRKRTGGKTKKSTENGGCVCSEDRRGTEINCEGLRVNAGWRRGDSGKRTSKRERYREKDRERGRARARRRGGRKREGARERERRRVG